MIITTIATLGTERERSRLQPDNSAIFQYFHYFVAHTFPLCTLVWQHVHKHFKYIRQFSDDKEPILNVINNIGVLEIKIQ